MSTSDLQSGLQKIEDALSERERENMLWRPMMFHLFASLEMERLMEVADERGREKESLHKKISELEIAVKRNEGMAEELRQAKLREKDLQRIADEQKAESDSLRARMMQAGSQSKDGFEDIKTGLEKQLKIANTEVERLQRLVAEKSEELEQLQSGNVDAADLQKRHRSEIEGFKKKLKDRDKEKEEWVEERNGFLLQIQELKTQLASKKNDDTGLTEDMMNQVHFYQTEIETYKNKSINYESMLDEMSKMNEFLTAQAKENENKRKDLENQLRLLEQKAGDTGALSKDLDEAKSKIFKLEAEIRNLNDQVADQDKKLKAANSKYTQLETDYSELQSKYDKLNRDKLKNNDEVDEHKLKVELLEKKIQVKDEEIKRLGDRINAMRTESGNIQALESHIYGLERKNKELEAENQTLNNDKKNLQQKLMLLEESKNSSADQMKRERDDLANQVGLLNGDIIRLKARLEDRENEISELNSKIKDLRKDKNQISDLENIVEEFRIKLEKANKEKDQWKEKAVAAESNGADAEAYKEKLRLANIRLQELDSELRNKRNINSSLQERLAEIEELKNTEAMLRSQLRNAREELESTLRDLERLKINNNGLEVQLREMGSLSTIVKDKNKELEELETRLGELMAANKELKMKLIEADQSGPSFKALDQSAELNREIDGLRSMIRNKDDEIKRLNFNLLELGDARKKYDSLEDDLNSLRRQLEKVSAQRDRLKFENEELKRVLDDGNLLKYKIDELNFRIASHDAEMEVKNKKISFLEDENSNLNSRLRNLKRTGEENEDFRNEMMGLQDENSKLKRLLDDKVEELQTVNSQNRQLKDRADLSTAEREKIRKLERDLMQKDDETNSLISRMKELQIQFEELKRELEDSNQVEKLREDLNRMNRNYAQLEMTTSQKIRSLEEENSDLKRKNMMAEEMKLMMKRDNDIALENISARQKELERQLQRNDPARAKDFQYISNQLDDLRAKLLRAEQQKSAENSELRQKVVDLQRQVVEQKFELDRQRHISEEQDRRATIEAASMRTSLGPKTASLHDPSRRNNYMSVDEREELNKEIALLREKLVQKDDLIYNNEAELRRLRSAAAKPDRSLDRKRGDFPVSPGFSDMNTTPTRPGQRYTHTEVVHITEHNQKVEHLEEQIRTLNSIIEQKDAMLQRLQRYFNEPEDARGSKYRIRPHDLDADYYGDSNGKSLHAENRSLKDEIDRLTNLLRRNQLNNQDSLEDSLKKSLNQPRTYGMPSDGSGGGHRPRNISPYTNLRNNS